MDDDLIAFIDESRKPIRDPRTGKVDHTHAVYVIAAVVVFRGDLDRLRRVMEQLVDGLGVPLHYSDLTSARRLEATDRLAHTDNWESWGFTTGRQRITRKTPDSRLRAETLKQAVLQLHRSVGVNEVVLETRDTPRQAKTTLNDADFRVINRLQAQEQIASGFQARHDTKSEPVLWLADVVAGAVTDFLCGTQLEPFACLSHRIVQSDRRE